MPCGQALSAQFNKPEMKLNVREIEWKSLMNECLMGTEIFQNCENKSEEFLNPISAMDLRHKMARESAKILCTPQIQTQTEALKLLRIKNYNRMLKQKEGKTIEKEIAKLKETMENNRSLIQAKLQEAVRKRIRPPPNTPKFVKCYRKHWKRLELHDGVCEVDTWLNGSVQMTMETKINQQGIPCNVKVSLKREVGTEESLEPAPTPDGSTITDEIESGKEISVTNESKTEIMRRYYQESTQSIDKEFNHLKKDEKINEIELMRKKTNIRIISQAWKTWRIYTQRHKSRIKEKKLYTSKIEKFLSKLKDVETGGRKRNVNHETMINFRLKETEKRREKEMTNEEKQKHLKNLMEEVRASQTEAYQKLQEINKTNLRNRENPKNLEFLKRIEERREERLKRWKEIERKKLEMEEERKKAEKLKEDEKRKKEEENKRKKLEEWREKRRLEMEKKKAREREKERLQTNTKLAENHYRRYLLRSFGLRPWILLMNIQDSLEQRALAFYQRKLTRKAFNWLISNVLEQTRLKTFCATEFHEKILKKNSFRLWLDFHWENIKQNQVAADWNEFRITERAFKKWLEFTQDEQLEYLSKKDAALLNYQRKLKMKYLKKLRDYPELKKLEQAKENRKRKWRQRVKEILPDYHPVELSSTNL